MAQAAERTDRGAGSRPPDRRTQEASLKAQAWSDQGISLAQSGRMDEAIQAWEKAAALDKNLVAPRFNLALILIRQGKTTEALKLLEEVRPLGRENPALLRLYGEISLTAGAAGPALVAFSDALCIDDQDIDSILGLAEARLLRKEFAEANRLIDRAAVLDPANPRAALLRTHHLIETSADEVVRDVETDGQLEQALTNPELRLQAAYLVGRLRLRQRRFGEAVTYFRLPLDANPRDLNARFMLVRALEGASRTNEARRELALYDRLFSLQTRIAAARARREHGGDVPALNRKLAALESEEKLLLGLR